MNFVADEGVDALIVAHLRLAGHSVWYVAEVSSGVDDLTVLNLANEKNALLLTADKDFGDLVFRQHQVNQGVILLRLHGLAPERKTEIVLRTIQAHEHQLTNAFTVVTTEKVRIRRSR